MLAFSVLNALWVVFVAFLFINVLMLMFAVLVDLIRDKELSGWAKFGWVVALLFLPLIGLLVYVIVRGDGMASRAEAEQAAARDSFDSYVRDVSAVDPATQLEKAGAMHAAGQISDDEYAALKSKILG